MYAHIRPCVHVQLKYGKMIHFLFPEKAFLHHLIGMTGTFFALYLSFFLIFYYSIFLMASLAFFFLKHALGYNVYPAPSFSDRDHLFWMRTLQFSIAGFYIS